MAKKTVIDTTGGDKSAAKKGGPKPKTTAQPPASDAPRAEAPRVSTADDSPTSSATPHRTRGGGGRKWIGPAAIGVAVILLLIGVFSVFSGDSTTTDVVAEKPLPPVVATTPDSKPTTSTGYARIKACLERGKPEFRELIHFRKGKKAGTIQRNTKTIDQKGLLDAWKVARTSCGAKAIQASSS